MVQQRQRFTVRGIVQGVGFRPFVYRLAQQLSLSGWVQNDGHGVTIEAQGPIAALSALALRLREEAPALARIDQLEAVDLPAMDPAPSEFEIRASALSGAEA